MEPSTVLVDDLSLESLRETVASDRRGLYSDQGVLTQSVIAVKTLAYLSLRPSGLLLFSDMAMLGDKAVKVYLGEVHMTCKVISVSAVDRRRLVSHL
jgi:hypothetical protein